MKAKILKLLHVCLLFCTYLHYTCFLILLFDFESILSRYSTALCFIVRDERLKEDFWMMKEALSAQFKKESDKRCIGDTGFFSTETLMEKEDVETNLAKKLDNQVFTEP